MNTVREQVDLCLASIERDGLNRFCVGVDAMRFLSVRKIFADLRIDSGYVVGRLGVPVRIYIEEPRHVTMTRIDSLRVLRAIEIEVLS